MKNSQSFFIIDGYGLIFREYYAFLKRPLTNSKGENISALHGFLNNIALTIREFKPDFLAVALDSKTPTFRHEMYTEYKANRNPAPDDLKAQFPWIEDFLLELNAAGIRANGFEADDVIATLAKKAAGEGKQVFILTKDKDLLQLVGGNIFAMSPGKSKIWEIVDSEQIKKDWGVAPNQILDYLSLTGDNADNVQGVRSVGEKTAAKLLCQYGTLDEIYAHAAEIKGALGVKMREDKEKAYFAKKLIALKDDVPLDFDLSKYEVSSFNFKAVSKKCRDFSLLRAASLFEELASKTLDFGEAEPEIKKNAGNYKAILNIADLNETVENAILAGICAVDTETNSLNTRQASLIGFSISFKAGSGFYIPLVSPNCHTLVSKEEAFSALARLFKSKITLVFHNAKFDLQVLFSNGFLPFLQETAPISNENQLELFADENAEKKSSRIEDFDLFFEQDAEIFDTMIVAWILSPDSEFSLEKLAEKHLLLKGIEFSEIVAKKQTFADVPLETAANYCSEDSDFTLRLYEKFRKELESSTLLNVYRNEISLIRVLSKMELFGIHIDLGILSEYSGELSQKIDGLSQKIFAAVGHEFNIASPKQLGEVLFDEMKLKGKKKTKNGNYSTDEATLSALKENPIVADILDFRAKSKLLSTYVDALPLLADEQSRVHTSFMQTGTATGRLSSRDPNLQNIPVRTEEGRRIRRAFTAEKGSVLISADYAQIELVVLAHLSGDENLCRAFLDGVDVHKSTASLIYGVPMENVSAEMRRNAKTFNFGIMYGMGAFSLASDLGISYMDADKFIKSYFEIYSGVKAFFDKTILETENTLHTTTISGRKREIQGIASANQKTREAAVRAAKNSPIQGSAADIVKKAMLDLDEAFKANPTGAKMLLQVHDELIFECPDNEKAISDTIALIKDKMEHAYRLRVPLRVSVEFGKNWGEFH